MREYGVGYGKPPHQSRFKMGLSGNPKGRPRRPEPDPLVCCVRAWRLQDSGVRSTVLVAKKRSNTSKAVPDRRET
jgi:hypothetical protein